MFLMSFALMAQSAVMTLPAQPTPQPIVAARPAQPPRADEDSPEEIAKDSARDLKDSRFYNKPGATRADYDRDWQECRLIARGSRTPTGSAVVVYNPNIISPAAAAGAGLLGALIAGAIQDGEARRANRRSCLLVRGWRLVEVDDAEQARLLAMSDAEREAHFNAIVGAEAPPRALVTAWSNDYAAPKLAPESEQ